MSVDARPGILFLCVANSAGVNDIDAGSTRRLHWPIPDPATNDPDVTRNEMLRRVRGARDAIRARLAAFAHELRS